MSAEMMEMKESQEAQRNQELLERSNRVMDGAVQLLAELDGVSEADVREKLAEEVSRPTELQQFMEMELERVKENIRGDKSAQVSFGQSVEIRCKTTDVKNAVANNNEIAAKNRAKELADMLENERKKEEEKKARQEQERQEKERQEQQKKAK